MIIVAEGNIRWLFRESHGSSKIALRGRMQSYVVLKQVICSDHQIVKGLMELDSEG
jgi:hypothetical protein